MRTISQYDARRYKDELEGLREEMTRILLEMEQRHSSSSREAFSQWWEAERIEQILMYSVVEEEEFPKMRGPQRGAGRDGYGQ